MWKLLFGMQFVPASAAAIFRRNGKKRATKTNAAPYRTNSHWPISYALLRQSKTMPGMNIDALGFCSEERGSHQSHLRRQRQPDALKSYGRFDDAYPIASS